MFENILSFKGRIRRREFAFTYLGLFLGQFVVSLIGELSDNHLGSMVTIGPILLIYYIFIAQGAKRCHDRGHSGWYQLIPFYVLWMLFSEGQPGANEYGPNPKHNQPFRDDTILDAGEFV